MHSKDGVKLIAGRANTEFRKQGRQTPSLPKLKFMEGFYEEQAQSTREDAAQETGTPAQIRRRDTRGKWR